MPETPDPSGHRASPRHLHLPLPPGTPVRSHRVVSTAASSPRISTMTSSPLSTSLRGMALPRPPVSRFVRNAVPRTPAEERSHQESTPTGIGTMNTPPSSSSSLTKGVVVVDTPEPECPVSLAPLVGAKEMAVTKTPPVDTTPTQMDRTPPEPSFSLAPSDSEDATLPPGWVQYYTDAPNPVPYYLYTLDGTTQWERPTQRYDTTPDDSNVTVPWLPPLEQETAKAAPPEDAMEPTIAAVIAPGVEAPNAAEATDQPLPDGWVQQYTDDQVPYYVYEPDGTTQWERPSVVAEAPVDLATPVVSKEEEEEEEAVSPEIPSAAPCLVEDALPEGWIQLYTEDDDQVPYYLFEPDGTTQWERPTVVLEAPLHLATPVASEEEISPEPRESVEVSPAVPALVEDVLPEGWIQLYTPDDQIPYYLYEPDGTTQWERPTVASSTVSEAPVDLAEAVEAEEDASPEPTEPVDTSPAVPALVDDTLPEGWVQQYTDDQIPYYLYEPDGTTQWDRPLISADLSEAPIELTAPVESKEDVSPTEPEEVPPLVPPLVEDALPEGWIQLYTDDDDQEPYYLYEPDGTTQWERPTPTMPDAVLDVAATETEELEPEAPAASQEGWNSQELREEDHQEGLPEGWLQQFTDDHQPYYVYEPDGTTQWDRPTGVESLTTPDQVDDDVVPNATTDTEHVETTPTNSEAEPEYVVAPDVSERKDDPLDATDMPPGEHQKTGAIDNALPEGWLELYTDDGNNEPYYLYEPDGTTQWDRPQASKPMSVDIDEIAVHEDEGAAAVPDETIGEAIDAEQIYSNPEVIPPQSTDTPEAIHANDNGRSEENTHGLDLPDGWIELWTDENIPYYLYEPDGSTQWEPPAPVARSKLPMNGENQNHLYSMDELPEVVQGAVGASPLKLTTLEDVTSHNLEESVDDDENNDFEIVDGEDDAYNYVAVLPPGWKEGFDDASGKPYYYSEIDGTIEWVRPTLDKEEDGGMDVVNESVETSNLSGKEVASSDFDSRAAVSSEPLPNGWVEVIDEASGMPYYLNEADGTTSWDRPTTEQDLMLDTVSDEINSKLQNGESQTETFGAMEDLPPEDVAYTNKIEEYESNLPSGWVEVYDESVGKPYYYDEVNDVTTWERPAGASNGASDEIVDAMKANVTDSEEDFVRETFPAVDNLASRQDGSLDKDEPADKLPPGWSKVVDESSGDIYFYCELDGSTSWDPPRHLSAANHDDSNVREHQFGVMSEGVAALDQSDAYESCPAPETSGQEGSRSLPSGWKELSDSDTGQVYYFNEMSGVSSWELPGEIVSEGIEGDVVLSKTLDTTDTLNGISNSSDDLLSSRAKSSGPMSSSSHHCLGRPAHAAASFGFGGRFCQVQSIGPSGSDVVVIRRLFSVTPNELLVQIERSKEEHGIVGPLNSSKESSVSTYVKYKASFDDLLWNLVSTASISQGKLRSKAGVSDSSSPEALIVRLLLPDVALSSSAEKKLPQVQGPIRDEVTLRAVEKLLLEGQTEKAVAEAIAGEQFALAMIIARCCGHEVYARSVQSYVDHAIPECRPLHTISLLLSGQLHPTGKGLTLPWDDISHCDLVHTWKNHLAAILSNRTEEWSQLALSLGDKLYEFGEVIFAHFCYMVGGSSLGSAVSNAKMVLLGCDFNPWDVVLATDESVAAFERTEAYEWAKRRGNPLATIHSLQSLKVMYAMLLADFGFVDAAQCYVESVLHCMDVTREDMQSCELDNGLLSVSILTSEQRGVLSALNCLDRRLTYSIRPMTMESDQPNILYSAPVDTSTEYDANASFMTAHTTFNETPLAPEPPGRLNDIPLKENRDQQSPPPSRSAMVPPLQPIDEGNARAECETSVNVAKQNAVSTSSKSISSIAGVIHRPTVDVAQKATSNVPGENGGARMDNDSNKTAAPKLEVAPSSAPANLQSSVTKAASSASASKKKGFFDLGIKDKVTKWLNPDATTADLGEGMDAYYDDKLKRWVFPGDDLEELAKPLGPPPTAPLTTLASSADDKTTLTDKATDPLAAMMAPPQRGPSALSRSRGSAQLTRPSPASMPILFPPGMSMPTLGGSTDSAAVPPLTNFSVFAPPPAPSVTSDDASSKDQ